jgi:diguanylate cyclase (GGDEF)-like protein
MAAALAATLIGLTLAAVPASWRQAAIVDEVTGESARTNAYQEAVYLATTEAVLLQASLREPDGEERRELPAVGSRTLAAVRGLSARDAAQAERNRRLAGLQEALQPVIGRYVALLDAGDEEAAHELLETRIEPVTDDILTGLRTEQQDQTRRYTVALDRAQRDSHLLRAGTLLAFLVGLAVCALVGWSQRAQRRMLERMAAQDALTGLPNRAAFQARLDAALAAAGAGAHRPTVLVLDLDGFREVNENLGHPAGDALLVEAGQRLRRSVRGGDTVARLGGDEFAVLLGGADDDPGERAAARIGEVFDAPFHLDGITLDIEVSIGIATAGPDDDTTTLMRGADTAMHLAKERRSGYTRFDAGRAQETSTRLSLLGDLRRALDAGQITLHYQPKIALGSGEVIGAEALARWQHPDRGAVPPGAFIPVLESTNLIHRFTVHVLHLALAQARAWRDGGHPIPVAVNVSTRCLLDPAFPDAVARALDDAGLPGGSLCIEITESTVMADPDRTIEVLRRIRALGVTTAVDDFGTGYSSMAYLKDLPVDEIKVDRSFVRDMSTDHGNHVLVGSTVNLGHNLGLVVVAEGVEDDSTAAALHGLGCDVAQGYHFARPLPAAAFDEFLAGRRAVSPA